MSPVQFRLNPARLIAATCIAVLTISLFTGCAAMKKGGKVSDAQSVIDAYIEATGGKAAHMAVKSRIMEGVFEMPDAGIKGNLSVFNDGPNGYLMTIGFDGFTGFSRGSNGDIVWEIHPMNGARILEGDELKATRFDMKINPFLDWRSTFKTAKLTGTEKVDDHDCYRIEMGGVATPQTFFFERKSNELVKMEMTTSTQQGDFEIEVFYADYRPVDNVRLPFSQTMVIMGQKQFITIENVTNNPDIPAETFAVPDDIKEMISN